MSAEVLSSLVTKSIGLSKSGAQKPPKLKLKVFWKTSNFWDINAINEYHREAPLIANQLTIEKYWQKDGSIQNARFTCEDFAIRTLCEFASKRLLPVKLKTGTRLYKNMEIYIPSEHDCYSNHMYGFTEMVMLTYGAPDMQRTGENVISIPSPEALLPGDILAQAYDRPGDIAHHIQLVTASNEQRIDIKQGNTSGISVRPFITVKRLLGSNMADPQNEDYAGMPIETGTYEKTAIVGTIKTCLLALKEMTF